jgi:spore coat polysaccharide biosynthesis predicted glycosyltransferase SpsG
MQPPSILFAINATTESGAGHVMRCLSLARELRDLGCKTFIEGTIEISWIRERLEQESVFQPSSKRDSYDLVVLDSYDVSFMNRTLVNFRSKKVVQFCDSNSVLVDVESVVWFEEGQFNLVSSWQQPRVVASGFSLLIPAPTLNRARLAERATNVAVILGGAPLPSIVDTVVQSIISPLFNSVTFHLWSDHVPNSARFFSNLLFHPLGSSLEPYLSSCDTMISSAGTSLWVNASGGRVIGVVGLVQNQLSNYEFATEIGVAHGLGFLLGSQDLIAENALEALLFDAEHRRSLYASLVDFVDSSGSQDLATILLHFIAE